MIDGIPYISIVVTSRNDNHGDSLHFRTQTFLNCLLDQCRRHQLAAELVIVEWNPPAGQPTLREIFNWAGSSPYCPVRIIQVPPHIHQRFKHSDKLPLFQMIAKNVGIRRSRAPFILATNIDILFSEELIAFLASRRLKVGVLYRTDRCDVPAEIPAERPTAQLLSFCRQNVIRIHKRWGSMDASTGDYPDGSVTWKTIVYELYQQLRGTVLEKRLHTNASGDFTLLDKSNWFGMRGYPQLEMLSMNIDGLGCQIAHFGGARERVLASPLRIYHIDHSNSPGWVPEGDGAVVARMNSGQIPQLTYLEYRELAIRMRREQRPIIMNDEKWGLGEEHLPEVAIRAS